MARKKPISVAAAEAKLRDAARLHEPGDWFLKVIANLPAGVDPALLDAAVERYLETGTLHDLRDLAAVDEAVVRHVERHEHDRPHAAFVAVGLRTGRGPIASRLRDLLELTAWTPPRRDVLRTLIAARPEIVEGARAAEAIGDPTSTTSPYLPILAVDGSADSLDILLPRFEAARANRDASLDWLRRVVVPLFGDTAAARAIVAMLDEAAGERAEVSPIWAFLAELGVAKPPAVVRFTVTFRALDGYPTMILTVDSAKAAWMHASRKNWFDGPIAPAEIAAKLGRFTVGYVLRTSAGLDREAIDRWVRTLLPTPS